MSNTIVNENGLLKINLNFLGDNYNNVKNNLKKSRIGCVLKSDAYGLGLVEVTKKLVKIGCKDFFLTNLEESLIVRKECSNSNIILLNGLINLDNDEIGKVFDNKIIPTINSLDELKKFHELSQNLNSKRNVTLHFDTGINRLGIDEKETIPVIEYCKKFEIKVFCVMSHLASADEKYNQFNNKQNLRFKKIIKNFPDATHSIANSHAIVNLSKFEYDLVRTGGCIFGTIETKPFKNVIELYAKVLQIKSTDNFEQSYGYNQTFQSKSKKRIAIIAFGYADGYPRILSNTSYVYFKKKLPLIGSISMDYMTVDISELDENVIKVGDFVELIGNNILLSVIAKKSKTIPYEILNNIGNRAKKIYIDCV
ncbi:MAG: alanine racemase [Rickettsiales bacterium]|nr:alanine racemase [Rickettsiales bacterium]|tara:strand:- start:1233 stop:2333 length:1101 start_codon:yes stop_codon:yes gene_type:complete